MSKVLSTITEKDATNITSLKLHTSIAVGLNCVHVGESDFFLTLSASY
jgi:hypothetical protein